MKKQKSKKDSDLPLNHYITVNFRCYLNLVFTTHEAHPNESPNFRTGKLTLIQLGL